MRYRRVLGTCTVLLLLTLAWWRGAIHAQVGDEPEAASTGMDGRGSTSEVEVGVDPDSPAVSSLTTDLPTCYQPDPASNACYINWDYISVASAPAGAMRYVTVTIGSRIRAVYRGFFQDSMIITNEMNGSGFKVPCGGFGASGDPSMGLQHSYSVVARDSDNATVGNYGSVWCPGIRLVNLPLVVKQ
ncbi:MAG: hypothetical protein MUF84_09655 [Anaerolineae bacterium]|nr:hypothetical protein [Anaerolineae bacterium]